MWNKLGRLHKPMDISDDSSSQEDEESIANESGYQGESEQPSSAMSSTNFASMEAIPTTDTDTSVLRKIIEGYSHLRNVSENDSPSVHQGRPQSLILAAGTIIHCESSPEHEGNVTSVTSCTNDKSLRSPYPNGISGLHLMHLIETGKLLETFKSLAHILHKASREITIDQLAQVLFSILQPDYSYDSEHLSERDSFLSHTKIPKLRDIGINNTGKELRSIFEQRMRPEKNIDNESSPEWHSTISKTPQNNSKLNTVAQGSSRKKRNEYFPTLLLFTTEFKEQNHILQATNRRETVTASPKKKKVCFKRNEERTPEKNMRRSLSVSDIFREESTTSVDSESMIEIDIFKKNPKLLQKTSPFSARESQERRKKYTKRKSNSLEHDSEIQGPKSCIDWSHIRPVSQTRLLFSPAARAQQQFKLQTTGRREQTLTVPMELNRKRILPTKTSELNSSRKPPWR